MMKLSNALFVVTVAGVLWAGAALAETPSTAPSTTDNIKAQASKTVDDVSKWTTTQWNAAKVKWSQENVKWDVCNKQATDKKLEGRESWSFVYTCMTN